MTRTWTPGRAAARFDRAIDAAPGETPAVEPRLLELVGAVRELPEVAPRPAYVAELRERLMVEADALAATSQTATSETAGATAEDRLRLRPRSPSTRRRRATVAVGTLAVLGVGASVGVAAQTALPGESLYGVKRAIEVARAQATTSDEARGEMLLAHAAARLDETLTVLSDPTDEAGMSQLTATLDSFSAEAGDASSLIIAEYERTGRRSLVERLRTFTAASDADLAAMVPDMPASGQDAWQRASEVVGTIDTDALAACPLCSADLQALSLTLPATPDFTGPTDGAGDPGGNAGPDASAEEPRTPTSGRDRTRDDDRSDGTDRPQGTGNDSSSGGDGTAPAAPMTPSPGAGGGADGGGGGGSDDDDAGLGRTVRKLTDPLSKGLGIGLGGRRDDDDRPRKAPGGSGSGSDGGGRSSGGGPVGDLLDGVDNLLP